MQLLIELNLVKRESKSYKNLSSVVAPTHAAIVIANRIQPIMHAKLLNFTLSGSLRFMTDVPRQIQVMYWEFYSSIKFVFHETVIRESL